MVPLGLLGPVHSPVAMAGPLTELCLFLVDQGQSLLPLALWDKCPLVDKMDRSQGVSCSKSAAGLVPRRFSRGQWANDRRRVYAEWGTHAGTCTPIHVCTRACAHTHALPRTPTQPLELRAGSPVRWWVSLLPLFSREEASGLGARNSPRSPTRAHLKGLARIPSCSISPSRRDEPGASLLQD